MGSLRDSTNQESIWELASKEIWIGTRTVDGILQTYIESSVWYSEWIDDIDPSRSWTDHSDSILAMSRIHDFS